MVDAPPYKPYVKRELVRGVLICSSAEYVVSWGSGVQYFDRAHMRVDVPHADGGDPEVYGVGLDAFLETYINAEELGSYRKTSVTLARVAKEAFVLETDRKGERTRTKVRSGDYGIPPNSWPMTPILALGRSPCGSASGTTRGRLFRRSGEHQHKASPSGETALGSGYCVEPRATTRDVAG